MINSEEFSEINNNSWSVDPNARVWVIEPKTCSVGAMPHNHQDFSSETAKQVINSIKHLFNKDNKNDK